MAAEAASTVVAAVAVSAAALREAAFAEAGVLAAVPIEVRRPHRAWARAPMEAHAGMALRTATRDMEARAHLAPLAPIA
jgi:hypothetical protein